MENNLRNGKKNDMKIRSLKVESLSFFGQQKSREI